mgnify:CR=1 FL=1
MWFWLLFKRLHIVHEADLYLFVYWSWPKFLHFNVSLLSNFTWHISQFVALLNRWSSSDVKDLISKEALFLEMDKRRFSSMESKAWKKHSPAFIAQEVFSKINFPSLSTKIKLKETIWCTFFLVVKLCSLWKASLNLSLLSVLTIFVSKSANPIIDNGQAYFAAFLS